MVDRRDISIPVNLAFLAALVAASAFVTVPSPDRMEAAAPPEHSNPQPEQVPADVPAANAANDVLRLTSVMMPPMPDELVPDEPVPDEPVPDEPALAAKTSKGPSPDTPPTEATPSENINQPADPAPTQVASAPTQSAPARLERTLTAADQTISAPAALTPLQMTSADPTPRLVPQPAPVVQASASTISARRLTPLVPASAQKVDNSMPALQPISPPVPVASAAPQSQTAPAARIQQGMTKAEITPMQAPARQRRQKDAASVVQSSPDFSEDPATEMTTPELAPPEMTPPEVAPQASDWQVADRLMDKAAQRLSLEFLWPADRQSHARIYTHLANCLGVETGIIDSASRVHLGQGGGRSFNTAMHSPFMRLVDRPVDPRESRAINRIRDRQGAGAGSGRAVRVFRRSHDMWLLAALNRAFGGLPSNGRVTAEYNLQGGRLYLGKLTLDGRRYEGRISLDRDSCA